MKIFFILYIFLLSLISLSKAQNANLYVPLNIQKAIKKGTRSYNGTPGPNYWQNHSDYKIKAKVLTDSSYLIGKETITYFNDSPDTLKKIVLRIYQDINKKSALRDWYVPPEKLNSGVKLNYILINKDTIDLTPQSKEFFRGSTNAVIKLKNNLNPKTKLIIKVSWQFKIPETLKIRMGSYGNGNMFISYWYPQVAVYDDIDGWDMIDYKGTVEFYNDFSNYNVEIDLPKGYLIWATGELQNAKENLRKDIYNRYQLAKNSDSVINIITQKDYKKGSVTAENIFNTWKFKAENVTDFSFAISKSYNWSGTSVIVGRENKHRVLTDAVYSDTAYNWNKAPEISKISIKYLSNKLPGYAYPYSHITSFCNGSKGGGMETPMMTNDGAPKSKISLTGLLSHEISHSYFPFIMGINERKYAWMDEGWASYFPREIVDHYIPGYDYWQNRVKAYQLFAGNESELPPIVPSYSNKGRYFRTAFYNRPTNAYRELEILLGRKLFKKALLEYINRWHGKHPIAYDFFFTFNNVANENLTWFWKPWFFDFGYPDLTIKSVKQINDEIFIDIAKIGNIPTRIFLTINFIDGSKKVISKSVRSWINNKNKVTIKTKAKKKVKSVIIGNKHIPDAVKENNIFTLP